MKFMVYGEKYSIFSVPLKAGSSDRAWRGVNNIPTDCCDISEVQNKDVIQDLSIAHQLGPSLNRPVNFKLGPKVCKALYKTRRPLIVVVRRLHWMSPTKYFGLKSRFTSQRTELFSGTD